MKTISNKNHHRLASNSSTCLDDKIPFILQPISILDIQVALDPTESPLSSSFTCSFCRQSDFANCTKQTIQRRWMAGLALSKSSTSFANNRQHETQSVKSPCKMLLEWMKSLSESSLEKMDLKFNICLTLTRVNKHDMKRRLWLSNLEPLCKRYQSWLLSKFKRNLNNLRKDPRMEQFSREKLTCLQIYCGFSKIKFRTLKFGSNLPPQMVYRSSKKRRAMLLKTQRKYSENPKKCPVQNQMDHPKEPIRKKTLRTKPALLKATGPILTNLKPTETNPNKNSLVTIPEKKHVIYRKSGKMPSKGGFQSDAFKRRKTRVDDRQLYQDYFHDEEDSHYTPSHILGKIDTHKDIPCKVEESPEIVDGGVKLIRVDDKSNSSSFVDRPKQTNRKCESWGQPKPSKINLTGDSFQDKELHVKIEIDIESDEKHSFELDASSNNCRSENDDSPEKVSKADVHVLSINQSSEKLDPERTNELLSKRNEDNVQRAAKKMVNWSARKENRTRNEKTTKYKKVSKAVQELIGNLETYKKRLSDLPGKMKRGVCNFES